MRSKGFTARATANERADSVREAIYVAFTLLAVLLVNVTHPFDDPFRFATTLAITSVALAVTMFVADVVSHIVAHDRGLSPIELRHAVRSSFTPLSIAVVPVLVVLLSGTGWWSAQLALQLAIAAVILGLGAVGWIAVRSVATNWRRRGLFVGALLAMSTTVVAIQIAAHS